YGSDSVCVTAIGSAVMSSASIRFMFFSVTRPQPPKSTLFPYTTLFRSLAARFGLVKGEIGLDHHGLEVFGRIVGCRQPDTDAHVDPPSRYGKSFPHRPKQPIGIILRLPRILDKGPEGHEFVPAQATANSVFPENPGQQAAHLAQQLITRQMAHRVV